MNPNDRLARLRPPSVYTSLLSVGGHTSLGAIGFETIAEVQGTYGALATLARGGWGRCASRDAQGRFIEPPEVIVAGSPADSRPPRRRPDDVPAPLGLTPGRTGPFDRHLLLRRSWETALSRLVEEASAIGADGVLGITLTDRRVGDPGDPPVHHFAATGTAVRSLGRVHPHRPFTTSLNAPGVGKLLSSGYVPAGLVVAVTAAKRHNDYASVQATRSMRTNAEAPAATAVANGVRRAVAAEIGRRTAALGADGSLLARPLRVRVYDLECDFVAEATAFADAIVSFRQPPVHRWSSTFVLPLTD